MRLIATIGDRLLNRLVPRLTAQAAPCEVIRYRCLSGSYMRCWYDQCQGYWLTCTRVGSC